uniref:RNA ligase 1 n=1 Tax=Cebus imitator TaxID=2715852 RepID=A0A2K5SBK3_CEBIM
MLEGAADHSARIPAEKYSICPALGPSDQPYLWARLDRKPNKQAEKRFKNFLHSKGNPKEFFWNVEEDFKPAAECWIPAKEIEQINANPVPDENGHIPGWVPVEKNNKQYCWHSCVVNYELEIALVHRHHLGLCWPIPDTYMNSRPVIINMNLNKCDSAFDLSVCLIIFQK